MGRPNADAEFQKRMVTCEVFPSKDHWRVPTKPIFGTKFDPQNGPRSPRGHPKPGSDTERGSQSASSAPGDAPGTQLEEIRGPGGGPPEPRNLEFSVKKMSRFSISQIHGFECARGEQPASPKWRRSLILAPSPPPRILKPTPLKNGTPRTLHIWGRGAGCLGCSWAARASARQRGTKPCATWYR